MVDIVASEADQEARDFKMQEANLSSVEYGGILTCDKRGKTCLILSALLKAHWTQTLSRCFSERITVYFTAPFRIYI